MPQIIPIRDLKNTSEISELVHKSNEPIFVTKNGYGDMVIMSIETYEKTAFIQDIYSKLEQGEQSINSGKTRDAINALNETKEKYGL